MGHRFHILQTEYLIYCWHYSTFIVSYNLSRSSCFDLLYIIFPNKLILWHTQNTIETFLVYSIFIYFNILLIFNNTFMPHLLNFIWNLYEIVWKNVEPIFLLNRSIELYSKLELICRMQTFPLPTWFNRTAHFLLQLLVGESYFQDRFLFC